MIFSRNNFSIEIFFYCLRILDHQLLKNLVSLVLLEIIKDTKLKNQIRLFFVLLNICRLIFHNHIIIIETQHTIFITIPKAMRWKVCERQPNYYYQPKYYHRTCLGQVACWRVTHKADRATEKKKWCKDSLKRQSTQLRD